MDIMVRAARVGDLSGIDEIYDHVILTSPATFDLEPKAPEWRAAWFAEHAETGPHRVLVALDGKEVVGFASSGPHRAKRAYAGIVQPNEASVALHRKFGFREAGRFTEQGRKFGRYWDVVWYEKPLD